MNKFLIVGLPQAKSIRTARSAIRPEVLQDIKEFETPWMFWSSSVASTEGSAARSASAGIARATSRHSENPAFQVVT
jgi:hypothetical protein